MTPEIKLMCDVMLPSPLEAKDYKTLRTDSEELYARRDINFASRSKGLDSTDRQQTLRRSGWKVTINKRGPGAGNFPSVTRTDGKGLGKLVFRSTRSPEAGEAASSTRKIIIAVLFIER